MNKIENAIKLMQTFKNWQDIGLDYMGLKKEPYVLETRDELFIEVRPGLSDVGVVNELMCRPFYKDFKNKKIVIDIGAHIGVFSLMAAHNGSTVYSYEPLPENFEILGNNIYLNNFYKKMFTYNVAVAGKKGIMKLNLFGSPAGASLTIKPFNKQHGKISVKTITLEDIFKVHHIKKCDLLKIDAEGAEFDMLFHTPKKVFNKIDSIFVECANWVDPNRPRLIKEFLQSIGYFISDEYVDRRDVLLIAKKNL